MERRFKVGVVGAGIAGLACAQTLRNNGVDVTVLEKSRGIGGRVATRRIDSGASFDHGAQYFTVTDAIFEKQVKLWCDLGVAGVWHGRIVSLQDGEFADLQEPRDRFIGVPTMNAIAQSLALDLDVRNDVTVQAVCLSNGKWQLRDATGTQHGPYDFVISTAPPLQTRTLLGDRSATVAGRVSEVRMALLGRTL
jgi:predicted NAD/FAD-dependent oxidoreductase